MRITVRDAKKTVGTRSHNRVLWEGINVDIDAGERVCITGESGCGKSTLLNCIGLLEKFDAGQLFLNGVDLTQASTRTKMRFRRETIGYLFQDYALIDNETVAQNVTLAARSNAKKSPQSLHTALEIVGLRGREQEKVYQLSGGEQQRVAIARLLVRQPDIVLADEPTASLDRGNATTILEQLDILAAKGASIVIVSHDPWVVEQCDRTVELKKNV
ncbi:ABC transporter ATP-binding protein [Corynebacterium sp. sy017]|uniref:ABC transporter ATP-binding protein n=1 Tax=unclassified Corynebacterium TaxID=2624378 RepID=UPI00118666CD|nr:MULTISPECIES: ABC transporter ATP-binding protein [unclassified Corynebacterium]MBP3089138.1 ABC transporter ATP-binding protein [Corynebacterium sp. sy017]TSD91451.1 ABC transporter ATP-binding protein [Corynebacterium sp. SY003]